MNLFHQIFCSCIHTGINKFFPYISCSKIIGMYQVFGIKPVVSQIINHQFIRGEIIQFFKLIYEVMDRLDQYSLAPVIFNDAFAQMPDGANSENDLQFGVEKEQAMDYIIKYT